MAARTPHPRAKTARCPEHGLVLVDGQRCTLCKGSRARTTSPWIIAFLGGVALAALFAVRALDVDEPRAAAPLPPPSSSVTTRIERSRPMFERVPAREAPPEPTPALSAPPPAAAPARLPGPDGTDSSEAISAEDRLLGQPTAAPDTIHAERARPPEPPSVRGFPLPAREDDPADFE
jgi:hypothetical protein